MSDLDTLIFAAFPVEPIPDVTLHEAVLADQTMDRQIADGEWKQARTKDAGRSWQDYTDDELISCEVGLAHLPEESFVYYIPAFMRCADKYIGVECDHKIWMVVGSTIFSLTHRSAYNLSRLKRFNALQRDAIIRFLELVGSTSTCGYAEDAEKALVRYWKSDEATKPLIVVS